MEEAIDKQLGKEEELKKKLQKSEEEIKTLLEEIQNFELKLENGESTSGGASFVELRNTKKSLAEKEETVASQKLQSVGLYDELWPLVDFLSNMLTDNYVLGRDWDTGCAYATEYRCQCS